ncbi:MAG: hypothetical protein ABIQ02_10680 [Saprospiraceae bacterium]
MTRTDKELEELVTVEEDMSHEENGKVLSGDNANPISERKEIIEDLFEKAETYAKTNIELFKLKFADKIAVIIASLVSRIISVILFSIFFLLVNVGVAIWLGEELGHLYYGFFVIAGVYLFITLIIHISRDKLIKRPIIDTIISQILK